MDPIEKKITNLGERRNAVVTDTFLYDCGERGQRTLRTGRNWFEHRRGSLPCRAGASSLTHYLSISFHQPASLSETA